MVHEKNDYLQNMRRGNITKSQKMSVLRRDDTW